mgnify:FL=1
MNCELNGMKIKYEDGKLWSWRELKSKPSYWREIKACSNKNDKYKRVTINYKTFLFHRVVYFIHNPDWDIQDISVDNHIDHIDRDRLNNSIENLRVVTNQQNCFNQNCKGYSFHKRVEKYSAQIRVNRKPINLGYFANEEDARQAYLEAKKIYHPM